MDGGWASWEEWTDCSVECDSGSRTRVRECDNPAPQNGGRTCDGDDEEIEGCNEHECPSEPSYAFYHYWYIFSCPKNYLI